MKLLLSLVLACAMMLGSAFATEFKDTGYWHMEGRVDVFWINLQCDGEYVDLDAPPPNYDPEQDPNLSRISEIGYEERWRAYFWQENPPLKWNGLSFDINDESPNFVDPYITSYTTWWSMYFNEMYYDGGPVWEDELMEEFWSNLTFKGKRVNVYAAPPNYDPDLDYWSFMRDKIGYAWYWEYYIASQMNRLDDNPTDLKWKGMAFDVHSYPPDFNWEADIKAPFYLNRYMRGYIAEWAEYFVYGHS